jgi:tetratricopeptide (TPR) repeat protein
VSQPSDRAPILTKFYGRYLLQEDAARFIKSVSQRYTTSTLERLAQGGAPAVRRAAMLALGFVAPYESNPVLARGLHDSDRGVRILAETGIRWLWERAGSEEQRQRLRIIIRLNTARQFEEAAEQAGRLLAEAPTFAEAWNQRAIAYYHLDRYEDSAEDCLQALELNPYHFAAAVQLGHCRLGTSDVMAALACFHRALRLNPDLEGVRAQVRYLRRSLEGK